MDFSLATPKEIEAEFAQRIRLARVSRNMTQPDLAERVGVSVGTIRNLERSGDCAFSTIIKVALALRLEKGLDDLFKVGVQSIEELIDMDRAKRTVRKRAGRRNP
ncbi:helix-turn-helix domain-containing protein [Stenotrophomonas sp.]|uniref:helix-turn-helix transcriptional regulator n=1 Tax=Stenotrophomonas sp. TaxID=69392 RepID=UPI0028A1FC2F|nr:helix-turn-helix domain-containing protein [Stenotrophomonas sp.]